MTQRPGERTTQDTSQSGSDSTVPAADSDTNDVNHGDVDVAAEADDEYEDL